MATQVWLNHSVAQSHHIHYTTSITNVVSKRWALLLGFMGKNQSRWSRLLKRGSAASRLLGMRVLTLPGHGSLSLVSVVCCYVEVSATGRLLVQSSPTEPGVSECDLETSIMRRPRPIEGRWAMKKIVRRWFQFISINVQRDATIRSLYFILLQ